MSCLSCPHPNRDCYLCELEALDQGNPAAEVTIADRDCCCGCGQVVLDRDAVKCLGCGVAS